MISVIIPVFQEVQFLPAAIQSALHQPPGSVCEVIVVDDGNPPILQQQIAQLAEQDNRVRVLRLHENLGRSAARNAGIDQALGSYLLFLDADDQLAPDFAAQALHHLQLHPQWSGVWGTCQLEGTPSSFTRRYFRHQQHTLRKLPPFHALLFAAYCPPIHCMVVKRQAVGEHQFPTGINYGEDRLFWMQLKDSGALLGPMPAVAGMYRIRSGNKENDAIPFFTTLTRHTASQVRAYGAAMMALQLLRVRNYVTGARALRLAFSVHPLVAFRIAIRIFMIKFLNF